MEIEIQDTQPRRRLDFEQDGDLTQAGQEVEMMNTLHSKIPKEAIPRVGMEFECEEEAYVFYNAYALLAGFSVRKSGTHKCKGAILDRTFVCSCQGKRGRDKRENLYKSHRSETRFGCLAMLKISCRVIGKYRVVNFIAEHNHTLASPIKSHLFRSHRGISAAQSLEVDLADISGIAPKQAFEFMARQAGGHENLGFAHVDYKNYLRSKRTLKIKSGDTGGVLEFLQSMKEKDPSFFYAIQVDEDDLITNTFWADAKMMSDYEDFGDVVCFDTTYRKHKDGRPIALFFGVNHHKQTTIFGAALLYDEKAESFVWLFDTFSRAMGDKLPKTMLTDQDPVMSLALASQWPETRHRLCIWHIFQNATIHLSWVFSRYTNDFSRDFSNCIYDYENEEDFIDAWNKMLEKYELQDNSWLKRMFNIKEKWALVYGRDTFCADMTTTQRSESMNKLIKSYISYKHDLRRFFENFQRLLEGRRYDEMVADFKASQSKVTPSYHVAILDHAASVYTPLVFVSFQEQLWKSYDCQLEVCGEMGTFQKYLVTPSRKHCNYAVSYYDDIEGTVCCTCRKFEFAGLLCCHILKVFSSRGITKIPTKYILKRWRKDAKKGSNRVVTESLSAEGNPKTTMGRRFRDLFRLSTRLFTRAAESSDGYTLVRESLLNLTREIDSRSTENPENPVHSNLQIHMGRNEHHDLVVNAHEKIHTVKGIKTKQKSGNQSSKRPRSALETAKRRNKRSKAQLCLSQGKPISQFDGSVAQDSTCFSYPWDPSQYVPPTFLEYAQGDMHIRPIDAQPSYTSLLTSIEMPQVPPM